MKKICLVFIVLFMVFLPNNRVYALEDSFYEGEYISGEYIKKFRNGTGKYEQLRFFKRKSDNQAVYCIQLWETLSSNKIISGYNYDQHLHANIDYSIWERIMLIAYYGYGYQGHTDDKWYVVTQFMIWRETSPDSTIYFTNTLNGSKVIKYEQEMNEINHLIQDHCNFPSFYNQTYQVKYSEPITIEDTNHALDRFDVTSDGGMHVVKNNSTLTFSSTYVGNSQIIFANTGKKYQGSPIVYIDNNGQNLLAPGNYYPIYMVINVELPFTNVAINKLDFDTKTAVSQGDGSLIGTRIQLLDCNYQLISEKDVGQDGKLVFENIGYGTYYVKEVKAGRGYLLDSEVIPVHVDQNVKSINLYNQIIKNEIVLTKYLRNPLTKKIRPEEGAVFSIYNSRNEKVDSFITDSNGIIETSLPYGVYKVKQEFGTKNHIYVDDFEIKITKDNQVQRFELYNDEIVSNIKIINLDKDSNLPILETGAQFYVKDLVNDQYIKDQNGKNIILETDDFGNTGFLTLACGKYQVEQIKAVDGYRKNLDNFVFEIDETVEFQLNNNDRYLEIRIPNDKQRAEILVEKSVEYYLNDYFIRREKEFNYSIFLYAKEDIYSKDGIRVYEKDQEVYRRITDKGDIKTPLLVLGNYYLKVDNSDIVLEIALTREETKKVELLDKKYDYYEEDDYQIVVPNTLARQEFIEKIPLILMILGFICIKGKKNYESD